MPAFPPKIPRLQTDNTAFNRFQDAVIEAFRVLSAVVAVQVWTSKTAPAPTEQMAGRFIRVKDAGKPEELWVCMRTSSGAYEWRSCVVASS